MEIVTDENSFSQTTIKDVSSKKKVNKFDSTDLERIDKISECPVYRPSKEEFDDPINYMQNIASEASKYGICKIICPIKTSIPAGRVLKGKKKKFMFETSVQSLQLAKYDKVTNFSKGRKYSYRGFEKMADKVSARQFSCSACRHPPEYMEKKFWHELAFGENKTVEYGINVEGSAFSCNPDDQLGQSKWNLKKLKKQSTLRLIEGVIPGITDPMLYIGMVFSMFAWHVEDHYLYSINYHHCGASKTWYGVPGNAANQFERVVHDHVYCRDILSSKGVEGASKVLAEKTTMFPPSILMQQDVPVYKAVQMPGEFVITFPRAYHAGFSHGFNTGEAVNFAVGNWFPLGALASQRYALLCTFPIIPYEELLCNEAMIFFRSSEHEGSGDSSADLISQRSVKFTFVCLMRSYKQALQKFINLRASTRNSPDSKDIIVCILCHRDCYLAYLKCNCCNSGPICLYHDASVLACKCGSSHTIFLRKGISAMEDAAQKFEQEEDILSELQKETNYGDDVFVELSKIPYIIENSHHHEGSASGSISTMEEENTKIRGWGNYKKRRSSLSRGGNKVKVRFRLP